MQTYLEPPAPNANMNAAVGQPPFTTNFEAIDYSDSTGANKATAP